MRRARAGSFAALAIAGAAAMLITAPALAEKPARQSTPQSVPPTAPPVGPSHGPPTGPPPRTRNHDGRYYPPPGYVVPAPPPGYHVARHHHDRYYYGGGVWYRPYGSYYRVIMPPVGIVVPFLPSFYTTLWYGSTPYYYANSVYYVRNASGPGYVVAGPPYGAAIAGSSAAAPANEEFFVYPREGQNEETQSRDRYDCHLWAVEQTGFDPSVPWGGTPESDYATGSSEYRRAITACLDALGYSVR